MSIKQKLATFITECFKKGDGNMKIDNALQSLRSNPNVLAVKMDAGGAGMTKHEQDLRQQVTDLKAEAQTLQDDKKYEEAKAKLAEAKQAKSDLDNFLALQDDFNNLQVPQPQQRGTQLGGEPQGEKDNEYKALFFKTVRGQSLTSDEVDELEKYKARVSSDSGEDGGYIIPEDIQTRINELRQTNDDLRQYVNVQPVSTNKGSRTLERRAEHTPLQPLSEYGDPDAMAEMDSPKFDRLDYDIEDRAGFLPVPNSVLNDTDQALEDYLVRWISKKSKATDNHLILQQINSLTKETLNDYRGIKTTLNVTLDPAFAQEAAIYTNQDGFNYLDQLEDDNGRPLLQPDPTQPTRKLFAGAHPIVVLSNKTISTVVDETAGTEMAPFIIGVLDEGIVLWDRQQLSIDMTKVGGQAWRSNTTEFRAIVREDVTQWDDEAVVFAEIDVATPEA